MRSLIYTPHGGLLYAIAIVAFTAIVHLAGWRFGEPMLIAAAGLAPLAAIFAWTQPFVICALFVAFSYFRLPEAYPFLVAAKPALLLGTTAVTLVAFQTLITPLQTWVNSRTLKIMCMVSLIGCVAIAVPFSFIRSSGSQALDPLLIPAIMLIAALCAASWTVLFSAASRTPLPVNIILFSGFFIVICLTTIVSKNPGDSFDFWSSNIWKTAVMTFAIARLARRDGDFSAASNIFLWSGVLVAAVVFYNKIYDLSLVQGTRIAIGVPAAALPGEPAPEKSIAGSILSDPNDLALILMFPLAFALGRIVNRKSVTDMLMSAAMFAFTFTAIIFTQSRGALIGVAVVLAVVLMRRYRSAVLALLAVFMLIPIIFSAMNLASRDSGGVEEFSSGDLDNSAQHRVDAWKTAINMVAARPLTGIGIGNFPQFYYTYTNYWHKRAIAVHSMWFQIFSEVGLIGLALFVGMIWTSFKVNAENISMLERVRAPPRMRATAIALHAALAATCASGTFLSQGYTWPVYIIVGLIAALSTRAAALAHDELKLQPSIHGRAAVRDVRS